MARLRVADGDWRTIAGVVADISYVRINEPARPHVYLPFLQAYRASMSRHPGRRRPTCWSIRRARTSPRWTPICRC
jgi:hypothetical protein